jgi:hypothetical protein
MPTVKIEEKYFPSSFLLPFYFQVVLPLIASGWKAS